MGLTKSFYRLNFNQRLFESSERIAENKMPIEDEAKVMISPTKAICRNSRFQLSSLKKEIINEICSELRVRDMTVHK